MSRLTTLGPDRKTVLPEPWVIDDPAHPNGGVYDAEGLCRAVLIANLRGRRQPVSDADFHEALGYLLGQLVVIRYGDARKEVKPWDPAKGVPFRVYATFKLRWAISDFWEEFYGRHGQHRVVDDGTGVAGAGADLDDGDPGGRELGDPAAGDEADRVDARRWLESEADRLGLGDDAGSGLAARGAAAGGADRAGAGAGGRALGQATEADRPASWLDCVSCGWRTYRQAPNGLPGWHWPEECAGCGAPLEAPG
jgi:hypothetical protein